MDHRRPFRRRARPARLTVGVVAVSVALLVTGVAPTSAQEGPVPTDASTVPADPATAERNAGILERTLALAPEQPPAPDDPFVAPGEARKVEAAMALALLETTARSEDAARISAEAAAKAARAKKAEAGAVALLDRRRHQLRVEQNRLSDLTVRAYVTGRDYEIDAYEALLSGDTTDQTGGRTLLFEQVINDQEENTRAAAKARDEAVRALERARPARKVADADALVAAGTSRDRNDERARAASEHQRAIAAVDAAVEALRTAPQGLMVPLESAIVGLPRLDAADLALWFAQSPYRSKLVTPVGDLATWFIDEGRAEGIRGDIAFAQAVLETGGFTNNDSVLVNNYSGIGHCDTCPSGFPFPTARDGVRAQIQLLKSYAIAKPEYTEPLVDRRLRGPAGCCDTWGDLTTVWATDPTYGPKVMLIYSQIVNFALARRAAGQDLVPT